VGHGSDPARIGTGQYDFETVLTHELGHALGLGHSLNAGSVMYATLAPGSTNRALTTADLNIPDTDTSACGLHAAAPPAAEVSLGTPAEQDPKFLTGEGKSVLAPRALGPQATSAPSAVTAFSLTMTDFLPPGTPAAVPPNAVPAPHGERLATLPTAAFGGTDQGLPPPGIIGGAGSYFGITEAPAACPRGDAVPQLDEPSLELLDRFFREESVNPRERDIFRDGGERQGLVDRLTAPLADSWSPGLRAADQGEADGADARSRAEPELAAAPDCLMPTNPARAEGYTTGQVAVPLWEKGDFSWVRVGTAPNRKVVIEDLAIALVGASGFSQFQEKTSRARRRYGFS
jgi:hypothetical protein